MDESRQPDWSNERRISPWSHERVLTFTLLGLTALSVYLCYLLARPFLSVLAWALALAVASLPLHVWFERRIKQPSIAAAVTVFVVVVLLLTPAGFIIPQVINKAVEGVNMVRSQVESGNWKSTIERYEWVTMVWQWLELRMNLRDALQQAATLLTSAARSLVLGSFVGFVQMLMIFFLLFYFLRDRHAALNALRGLLPMTEAETSKMFTVVADTIYATIYGKLLLAILQGFLGGLMFWVLGLTAPWFWGIVMAVLSFVPVVGPFLVWLPAALLMILDGQWVQAIILSVWGVVVVSLVDNLLYPILVQDRLRLHTVPVFITMFGGLLLFGPAGFFLGPVSLTVTMAMLEIWKTRDVIRSHKHVPIPTRPFRRQFRR
jgi:predicted PurR-regulated permease PerM